MSPVITLDLTLLDPPLGERTQAAPIASVGHSAMVGAAPGDVGPPVPDGAHLGRPEDGVVALHELRDLVLRTAEALAACGFLHMRLCLGEQRPGTLWWSPHKNRRFTC